MAETPGVKDRLRRVKGTEVDQHVYFKDTWERPTIIIIQIDVLGLQLINIFNNYNNNKKQYICGEMIGQRKVVWTKRLVGKASR